MPENEEGTKLGELQNNKHNTHNYSVVEIITANESDYVKDLYQEHSLKAYIIESDDTIKMKFAFISTRTYSVGQRLLGLSLIFNNTTSNSDTVYLRGLNYFSDVSSYIEQNLRIYGFKISPIEKSTIKLNFKDIFFRQNKEALYYNKYKLHTKYIVTQNPNWDLQYLKTTQRKSHKRFLLKKCNSGAIDMDERIVQSFISQLFILENNDRMSIIDHSIIITQGGVGKSTILGYLGEPLSNLSEAGLFGYNNTAKNVWVTGKVQQTKKSLIIDEVNELFSKSEHKGFLLAMMNNTLEQGRFNVAKAGGRDIKFCNQFFLCGNMTDKFNFEQFVEQGFSNPKTVGRRFGILIYDNKLKFQAGTYKGFIENKTIVSAYSNLLSNILLHFLHKRKFLDDLSNNKTKNIWEKLKIHIDKVCNGLQDIKAINTIWFLQEYRKSNCRVGLLALKLAIFELCDDIIAHIQSGKNLDQYPKNKISDEYYKQFNRIVVQLSHSVTNIYNHLNSLDMEALHIQEEIRHFSNLNKHMKLFVLKIFSHKSIEIFNKNRKLDYNNLENVGDLKYFRKDILKYPNTIIKHNRILQNYGLCLSISNNDLTLVISNMYLYNKSVSVISRLLNYLPEQDIITLDTKKSKDEVVKTEAYFDMTPEKEKSTNIEIEEQEEDFY